MAFGYVYIMSNGNEYKIGLTGSDPEKRRGALNTASASRVDLLGYVLCKDMEELEAKLHREFIYNRKNGEWFEMNDSDLSKVLLIFKKESINDDMSKFPNFKENVSFKIDYVKMAEARRVQKVKENENNEAYLNAEVLCSLDMVRIQLLSEHPLYAHIWEKYNFYNPDKYNYDLVKKDNISDIFDDINWGKNTEEAQNLLEKLETIVSRVKK